MRKPNRPHTTLDVLVPISGVIGTVVGMFIAFQYIATSPQPLQFVELIDPIGVGLGITMVCLAVALVISTYVDRRNR